jgi:hypothetical protein
MSNLSIAGADFMTSSPGVLPSHSRERVEIEVRSRRIFADAQGFVVWKMAGGTGGLQGAAPTPPTAAATAGNG